MAEMDREAAIKEHRPRVQDIGRWPLGLKDEGKGDRREYQGDRSVARIG